MWRKSLALLLVLGALLGPCSAWSEPVPSSSGVYLSTSEYDAIVTTIEEAKAELEKSNATIETLSNQLKLSSEEIAKQSRALMRRSIFCGVLGAALVLNGVGLIIASIK